MWKKLSILLIVFTLVFTCAFDLIFDSETEMPAEWTEQEVSQVPETGDDVLNNFETGEEGQNSSETQEGETFPDQPVQQDPPEQPFMEEPSPEPEEQPQTPSWEGISEEQVNLLLSLYYEMTPTGKEYSGWFAEGNYSPCSWNGITCDEEGVSGFTFENTGYFTTFPESLMNFHNLKWK